MSLSEVDSGRDGLILNILGSGFRYLCQHKRRLKVKNRLSHLILVLLAFPLMFSCGGEGDDSGSGSDSIEIGTIAFDSTKDGNYEIYLMDSDGSNSRNISNRSSTDYSPAWSPDGSQLAFRVLDDSDRLGEIFVMEADGSNQRNISNSSSPEDSPAWSPDENHLAFATRREGSEDIYVMNVDGRDPRNISNSPSSIDGSPSWSPDGTRIVFTSVRDGNREIYTMDADGLSQTLLTNNPAWDYEPSWSPSGREIAFASNRDGQFQIYVMDTDGENQRRISTGSRINSSPA